MSETSVEIFDNTICELGEGPSYDPAVDALFWFDIVGRKLFERRLQNGKTLVHALPLMASAIAGIDKDRQLIATERGLYVRNRATGNLDMLQPIEADNPATRSNDARVHPCGAFWIGTMGKNAEREAGAIYWYRQGRLRLLFPHISIPNSICFSPDGSVAYFADSARGLLMHVDCDVATGLPDGDPEVFYDNRRQSGGLDGSIVDADGCLWNARWGGSAVDIYSPQGERIETIPMPVTQPSCPAFFGRDADRIAVTSAWQNMSDAARTGDPDAGKTFVLNRKVKGRIEPFVEI